MLRGCDSRTGDLSAVREALKDGRLLFGEAKAAALREMVFISEWVIGCVQELDGNDDKRVGEMAEVLELLAQCQLPCSFADQFANFYVSSKIRDKRFLRAMVGVYFWQPPTISHLVKKNCTPAFTELALFENWVSYDSYDPESDSLLGTLSASNNAAMIEAVFKHNYGWLPFASKDTEVFLTLPKDCLLYAETVRATSLTMLLFEGIDCILVDYGWLDNLVHIVCRYLVV